MFVRSFHLIAVLVMGTLLALGAAQAESRATLIADSVELRGDEILIAEGNVEILFEGQRLTATRILYDAGNDRLEITGPIVLTDGNGTVILADQAAMKADLTEGILTSARMVLDQQLQLAAAEVMRVSGRYTVLNRVVSSACKICAGSATPLWEIRARRVVHDQLEQQLYFEHAQLRMLGIPVFYVPRLRMPDPSLNRATGFLMPSMRASSKLGTGFKFPYFVTLGSSRDLEITPYISGMGGRAVELVYRQAFAKGEISLTGAVAEDRVLPGEVRGYVLATGSFKLPDDFRLKFLGQTVSDPDFLSDYGYPGHDRLESQIEVNRSRRNSYFTGQMTGFQSTRDGESFDSLPSVIGDLNYIYRLPNDTLGGQTVLNFQTHGHARASTSALDGDGDGIADGRDMARISMAADWRRDWQLQNGMTAALLGEVSAASYVIRQDAVYAGTQGRLHGTVGAELRWPWAKSASDGVTQLIEPVAQILWSPSGSDTLPNEDSTLVEFDQGNLFSLNRFPGSDAVERGARLNLGLNYTRVDPNGLNFGLAVGKVFRADNPMQFGVASGLDGISSDFLVAWQLGTKSGFEITNRFLFDNDFGVTKAETQIDFSQEKYSISAGYVHVVADESESRADPTSELIIDGKYHLTPSWTARMSSQYDFEAHSAVKADFGLAFRNECLLVDLSLSRRFTSSTSVEPTTEFGLSLELLGFGGGAESGPARQCRG